MSTTYRLNTFHELLIGVHLGMLLGKLVLEVAAYFLGDSKNQCICEACDSAEEVSDFADDVLDIVEDIEEIV